MTTTFQLQHDFPGLSVELFERHLNHPELIAMLDKMPAFRSRELVEKREGPSGSTTWRFKVVAGGEIPPAARKVLSEDMLTWWEDTKFVPADHCIYWTIVPLKEKVRDLLTASGTWKLMAHGTGTRRIIDGSISIKVPIVGKIAEAFLASELKRNYEVEPDIQRAFYEKMKSAA